MRVGVCKSLPEVDPVNTGVLLAEVVTSLQLLKRFQWPDRCPEGLAGAAKPTHIKRTHSPSHLPVSHSSHREPPAS